MKKVEIVLSFGEKRLEALEYSLRKERSSVQKKMNEALENLYAQAVCLHNTGKASARL